MGLTPASPAHWDESNSHGVQPSLLVSEKLVGSLVGVRIGVVTPAGARPIQDSRLALPAARQKNDYHHSYLGEIITETCNLFPPLRVILLKSVAEFVAERAGGAFRAADRRRERSHSGASPRVRACKTGRGPEDHRVDRGGVEVQEPFDDDVVQAHFGSSGGVA